MHGFSCLDFDFLVLWISHLASTPKAVILFKLSNFIEGYAIDGQSFFKTPYGTFRLAVILYNVTL